MIKFILMWLFIFVVGSLIVSFILSPEIRYSFTETIKEILEKVVNIFETSDIGDINNKTNGNSQTSSSENSFRCEDELKVWLKEEKIKAPSSFRVKVIEKKSFTNKTNLLNYINKWGVFNKYEIKKRIGEITKMPEAQGEYDLRREDNNFILDFNYGVGEIKSMRLLVTKGNIVNRICDRTIESNEGKIECDVSEYGNGEYRAEAYIDTIDKIWEGRIDTVLIKEEAEINYNDVAALTIGICEEQGKLIFS